MNVVSKISKPVPMRRFGLAALTALLALTIPLPESVLYRPSTAWGQTTEQQNSPTEATQLLEQAYELTQQEQFDTALETLEKAFKLFKTQQDLQGQSQSLFGIGDVHYLQGQYPEALSAFQRSLTIQQAISNPNSEDQGFQAITLTALGNIYNIQGVHQKALEHFTQALPLSKAAADRGQEAIALTNIGLLTSTLGDHHKALEYFTQSLPILKAEGDLKTEAITLNNMGLAYMALGETKKAREHFTQALPLSKAAADRGQGAIILTNMGHLTLTLGNHRKALEYFTQALPILKAEGDLKTEAITLNNMGLAYLSLGETQKALEHFTQALPILKEVGDRGTEAVTLNNLGQVYSNLGDKRKALEHYTLALPVLKAVGDRNAEATTLQNIALAHSDLGDKQKALEYYHQALPIPEALGDRKSKATILSGIGLVHSDLGQKQTALKYLEQAFELSKAIGDQYTQAVAINNLGLVYSDLGQKRKALEYFTQSLALNKGFEDQQFEATVLNNLGQVYFDLGQNQTALDYYSQSLPLSKKVGDQGLEAITLNNLGLIYDALGERQKALRYYSQALPILKAIGNRRVEATTLNNMGWLYHNLGNHQKSLDYLTQALPMLRSVGDRKIEARTLNNIGLVYSSLGQYQKALEHYSQALPIQRAVGDRNTEATTLTNLGWLYFNLGKTEKALDFYTQALPISRAVGDRRVEAATLNNIGLVYRDLDQTQKALDYFAQAFPLAKTVKDRSLEAIAFNNMGHLLSEQKQPELAIVFFKQAVNITESLRTDIQDLPRDLQQSYIQSVDYSYRFLADLLLQQDRILEAQQVLDLLKVQELENYLSTVRGNSQTAKGIATLSPEQGVLSNLNQLQDHAIGISKTLTQLRDVPKEQRTKTQNQQIATLEMQRQESVRQFAEFTRRPDIIAFAQQLSQTAKQQSLQLSSLRNISDNLKRLEQNAVLFYPLILEDRLELILATPDAPPIRRTVHVKRTDLNRTITQFRQALENSNSDAKEPARQLYEWLVHPLAKDLTAADAKTIIYAPDAQLRYVPLAALHDGDQWLIEKYRVNNITAASLTDLNTQPQRQLNVLAAAFSQGPFNFQVGNQEFSFNGLPFAGQEVKNLVSSIPSTTQLLDTAFSKQNILPQMQDHSVIHLATHAAFVPGQPQDSFILFGNGDRVTLQEVQDTWYLTNVDLMVLSACQTGLGSKLGNGEEILGFGYLMQTVGARAAMASLWAVDDGGTQALMNAFYDALKTEKITKAEALRQAQMAMITSNETAENQPRGNILVKSVREVLPPQVGDKFSHPYYWAPFILIGNGL